MKITFELNSDELKAIITSQIKEQTILFFQENKEDFVKVQFDKTLRELKQDGFLKRQVSSTLNKAIYDKVNRDFEELIKEKFDIEIDKVFEKLDTTKKLNDLIDKKVKERVRTLLDKV